MVIALLTAIVLLDLIGIFFIYRIFFRPDKVVDLLSDLITAIPCETINTKIYQGPHGLVVNKVVEYGGNSCKNGCLYSVSHGDGEETLRFHSGPLVNGNFTGLTNEALLAVLIDRTKILNDVLGSPENVRAIDYMEMALNAFETRTYDRLIRGVNHTGKH